MTTQPETPVLERVSRLEGAYDQVNERLGDLTQAMTNLYNEVHEVETRLNAKIEAQGEALRAEFRAETQSLNAKIDAQGEALTAKIDAQGREFRAETQGIREEIGHLRGEMHRQAFFVVGLLGGLMALLRFVG